MSALHAVREASLDAYHNQIVGGREQTQCDLVETGTLHPCPITGRRVNWIKPIPEQGAFL